MTILYTYAKEGLRQLIVLKSKYGELYLDFVEKFAAKLIDTARACNLPRLSSLPSLKDVPSAFHAPLSAPTCHSPSGEWQWGSSLCPIVFVAGQRTELQLEPRRKWLDCYGPEGGLDWKPYMPEISHEVAILAQTVASAENLRYEVVPLDVGLQFSDCLKVAEQSNKLVVIIVDTWTLLVKRYYTLMREYDSQNFLNCILVIPWNTKDDETVCNRELLEKMVLAAFRAKTHPKDSEFFSGYDRFSRHVQTSPRSGFE